MVAGVEVQHHGLVAVELVGALHGDVGGLKKLHLLAFAVAQGERAVQVVEVEVVELFLRYLWSCCYRIHDHRVGSAPRLGLQVLDLCDVAGHELNRYFGEVRAGVVLDGDPAGYVR